MRSFPRFRPTLTILTLALLAGTSAFAQETPAPAGRRGGAPAAAATPEGELPIIPETKSETKHDWTAGGRTVHYTATAGTLLINGDPGTPEATKPILSVFYVAYTEDGVPPKSRPITFLYNGGPGAATIWLHMGSVGPMRVVTQSPKDSGPPPYEMVQNQYSLIDKSDLVFIDAPLAGFSRAVGKGTVKDFAGVDQDIKAFNKFITKYITVNNRWSSQNLSAQLCGHRLVLQQGSAQRHAEGLGPEGTRIFQGRIRHRTRQG
jgi:carboxypeptidase C (cathepsin A)